MEVIDELISLRSPMRIGEEKKVNEDRGLNDIGGELEGSKEH